MAARLGLGFAASHNTTSAELIPRRHELGGSALNREGYVDLRATGRRPQLSARAAAPGPCLRALQARRPLERPLGGAAFARRGGRPLGAEIGLEVRGRERLGVEEALRLLALLVEQKARLRGGLDALGDDAQP